MKDKNFDIKVSDLLRNPWKTDQISFKKKISDKVQNLTKDWIRWKVNLRSLDKTSLSVTLNDLSCRVDDVCHACWIDYVREIDVNEYEIKFIIPDKKLWNLDKASQIEEWEVFYIDAKNVTIDIEEMVYQAILSEEPLTKRCKECLNKVIEGYDEDDLEFFETNDNVRFI